MTNVTELQALGRRLDAQNVVDRWEIKAGGLFVVYINKDRTDIREYQSFNHLEAVHPDYQAVKRGRRVLELAHELGIEDFSERTIYLLMHVIEIEYA